MNKILQCSTEPNYSTYDCPDELANKFADFFFDKIKNIRLDLIDHEVQKTYPVQKMILCKQMQYYETKCHQVDKVICHKIMPTWPHSCLGIKTMYWWTPSHYQHRKHTSTHKHHARWSERGSAFTFWEIIHWQWKQVVQIVIYNFSQNDGDPYWQFY